MIQKNVQFVTLYLSIDLLRDKYEFLRNLVLKQVYW